MKMQRNAMRFPLHAHKPRHAGARREEKPETKFWNKSHFTHFGKIRCVLIEMIVIYGND